MNKNINETFTGKKHNNDTNKLLKIKNVQIE